MFTADGLPVVSPLSVLWVWLTVVLLKVGGPGRKWTLSSWRWYLVSSVLMVTAVIFIQMGFAWKKRICFLVKDSMMLQSPAVGYQDMGEPYLNYGEYSALGKEYVTAS